MVSLVPSWYQVGTKLVCIYMLTSVVDRRVLTCFGRIVPLLEMFEGVVVVVVVTVAAAAALSVVNYYTLRYADAARCDRGTRERTLARPTERAPCKSAVSAIRLSPNNRQL